MLQVDVVNSRSGDNAFEICLIGEGLDPISGPMPQAVLSKGAGFTGKTGQQFVAFSEGSENAMLFVGIGSTRDQEAFRLAGATAMRSLAKDVLVARLISGSISADSLAAFVEGAILGNYRYDALRGTGFDLSSVHKLEKLEISGSSPERDRLVKRACLVAGATCLARDLINEHAATMTPTRFAELASEISASASLGCRVWDKAKIEEENLGGLLGVAKGSPEEPRFVKLTYRPKGKENSKADVALVGKGITFDSGGLSLKSGDGMMTMKTDMSGAAAVLATMSVVNVLEINLSVDGYMALTENMPSGSAQKPGDVLVARNGKSIEVLNTDAEGRLVLADALSLATEDGASSIIDLATLTGACVVALGREIAGVMGNNQNLTNEVLHAGEVAGEPLWQLPLPERYKKHIESEIADMKNIGAPGAAGTLSAALLLQEFVGEVPWVHLDIAGPSRSDSDERYFRKGGTGFGVRTLCKYLELKSR